jgi:hypothetical protein
MSLFELKRKEKVTNYFPTWCQNENSKIAYRGVLEKIKDIELLISDASGPLSKRQYKISKSAICKSLGLSGSYIAKHSKLNEFVDNYQVKLNRLSEDIIERQSRKSYAKKAPEQMQKSELVKEIKALRKQLSSRKSDLYVEQLKFLLNSGFSESHVVIKNRLQLLESDLESARKEISQKDSYIKQLTIDLTEAYSRLNR